jgi:hypothetical protein
MEMGNMPRKGEYEPSTMQLVRDQVELYESSGGTEGTTLGSLVGPEDAKRADLPVILLTTLGAKSGKIRKSPLMRVEHDGSYAVVASLGGAPQAPGLVPQRGGRPPGGASGRPVAPGHAGTRGDRGREGRVVGSSGRGVPGLCRLPEEDGP